MIHIWSLGWKDPWEQGMATHSNILTWRIPMDRGAWQITVHGVTKCWTQLSYFKPERWCCESAALNMPADLENSAVATGLEKVRLHSNPNKGNAEECSNYCTIALISHASKVVLKIPQARLEQYLNWEIPDVKAGLRKGGKNTQNNYTKKIFMTQIITMVWSHT